MTTRQRERNMECPECADGQCPPLEDVINEYLEAVEDEILDVLESVSRRNPSGHKATALRHALTLLDEVFLLLSDDE